MFAEELVRMRGPLGDGAFERAKNVLGVEGVAALIHLTRTCLYSSVLLNAADVCCNRLPVLYRDIRLLPSRPQDSISATFAYLVYG